MECLILILIKLLILLLEIRSVCKCVLILYRYVISYVHECSTLSVTAFIAISSYFIHGIYFTTAG